MLTSLLLLLSSACCLVYGLIKYFGRRVAMFSLLVLAALGCFMLGHLYESITLFIHGSVPAVFNVGILARIGGFAFIFSASFAQMDGLVDDHSETIRRYRFLALLAPFLIFLLFLPLLFSEIQTAEKIVVGVLFFFAGLSSYFNLKHFIIPDVSAGIIDSIRLYSLFSFLSALFYAAMCCGAKLGNTLLADCFAILLAISYPLIWLTMEKGRQKWIA